MVGVSVGLISGIELEFSVYICIELWRVKAGIYCCLELFNTLSVVHL